MKKIELEKNFFVFQFDPIKVDSVGNNIYMLINDNEAVLIDAGYEHQMKQILKDIDGKYNIEAIFPSHFHPDHIDGIQLLDTPEIYGNIHAVDTIKKYMPESLNLLKPTKILSNDTNITFGDFDLTFEYAPGHSDCSMIIYINDNYIHIGDLYITMNDGTDVLPFVSWTNVTKHFNSLKRIKELNHNILISHGKITIDYKDIQIGIEDRLSYLSKLLDSNNRCTVEEALEDCIRKFELTKWRKFVR